MHFDLVIGMGPTIRPHKFPVVQEGKVFYIAKSQGSLTLSPIPIKKACEAESFPIKVGDYMILSRKDEDGTSYMDSVCVMRIADGFAECQTCIG